MHSGAVVVVVVVASDDASLLPIDDHGAKMKRDSSFVPTEGERSRHLSCIPPHSFRYPRHLSMEPQRNVDQPSDDEP